MATTRRDPPKGIPRTVLPSGIAPGIIVDSFEGRVGTVVATAGDYDVSEVTGAAPLASPALTGDPTAPTQSPDDDSTKLATTAYVEAAVLAGGGGGGGAVDSVFTRTGDVVAVADDYDVSEVTGAAPLASPTFTGVPLAPTAAPLTDNTQIATTAYVEAAVTAGGGGGAVDSVFSRTGDVVAVADDYDVSEVTGAAPLASPTFTGIPAAPTAAPSTDTTQIATTAFVEAAVLAGGGGGPVDSVFGRTGVVIAVADDYDVSEVTGAAPLASPTFTGTIGLTSISTSRAFNISSGTVLTGATGQYGMVIQATCGSDATGANYGAYFQARGANAVHTTTNQIGILIDNSVKGTNQTVGTGYGIKINHQTRGSLNYSIYTTGPDDIASFGSILKMRGTIGIVCANQALATSATAGFLYIPSSAGTPTGTPTGETGTIPMIYDSSGDVLHVYNGSWKSVGGGGGGGLETGEYVPGDRAYMAAGRSTTASQWLGIHIIISAAGTGSTPVPADTNQLTRQRRFRFTGTTSSGSIIGWRSNETLIMPKMGYFWSAIVGIEVNITNMRHFHGMTNTVTGHYLSDPGLLTNAIGFGWDAAAGTGTNWKLMHNDAGGTMTQVDTGVARDTTSLYRFSIETADGTSYTCKIFNLSTGSEVYSGTITTNIPVVTTVHRWGCNERTTASGTAPQMALGNWRCEFGPSA